MASKTTTFPFDNDCTKAVTRAALEQVFRPNNRDESIQAFQNYISVLILQADKGAKSTTTQEFYNKVRKIKAQYVRIISGDDQSISNKRIAQELINEFISYMSRLLCNYTVAKQKKANDVVQRLELRHQTLVAFLRNFDLSYPEAVEKNQDIEAAKIALSFTSTQLSGKSGPSNQQYLNIALQMNLLDEQLYPKINVVLSQFVDYVSNEVIGATARLTTPISGRIQQDMDADADYSPEMGLERAKTVGAIVSEDDDSTASVQIVEQSAKKRNLINFVKVAMQSLGYQLEAFDENEVQLFVNELVLYGAGEKSALSLVYFDKNDADEIINKVTSSAKTSGIRSRG